jgi:hypothetical protein
MIDVISRQFPKAACAMKGMDNAVQPWRTR